MREVAEVFYRHRDDTSACLGRLEAIACLLSAASPESAESLKENLDDIASLITDQVEYLSNQLDEHEERLEKVLALADLKERVET